MPRRVKFDRESIIRAALDIVREGGPETLNARAVAARLGSSTQPLYSGLGSMDELRAQVYARAAALFNRQMADCGIEGVPLYKACGLTVLRFANEERALYRLLFLSDFARVANARACLEETAGRAAETVTAGALHRRIRHSSASVRRLLLRDRSAQADWSTVRVWSSRWAVNCSPKARMVASS